MLTTNSKENPSHKLLRIKAHEYDCSTNFIRVLNELGICKKQFDDLLKEQEIYRIQFTNLDAEIGEIRL